MHFDGTWEVSGFTGRKRHEVVSCMEPEAWLRVVQALSQAGCGEVGMGGQRQLLPDTGHGPKGQPLCLALWLGFWGMSFNSGLDLFIDRFIPGGSCQPLLFLI